MGSGEGKVEEMASRRVIRFHLAVLGGGEGSGPEWNFVSRCDFLTRATYFLGCLFQRHPSNAER